MLTNHFRSELFDDSAHVNKQINIVLFIHVCFYFTMTIDSELSERSLFSGSIIDKPVYSINKTQHTLYVCGSSSWMILWFVYICTVFYLDHLFIPILFMSWGLWFCYTSSYHIVSILFNVNMAPYYVDGNWCIIHC